MLHRVNIKDVTMYFIALSLTSLVASGCAIGNVGMLASRVTTTQSAKVIDVFSVGGWLRNSSFDRGASLGYRSATYVLPNDTNQETGQKWSFFVAPILQDKPLCVGSTMIGIEAQNSNFAQGASIGYKQTLTTVGPTLGESVVIQLRFDRNDPTKTFVDVSH